MVNETTTTLPAAAQQLPPSDPVAAAIRAHKHANAAYVAARDRAWSLTGLVDPDLDFDNLDEVRATLAAHYGDDAPARTDELLAAQEVNEALGDAEDEAWTRFADVPLNTAAQVCAYVAYVQALARTRDIEGTIFLGQALHRLAAMLGERLAA